MPKCRCYHTRARGAHNRPDCMHTSHILARRGGDTRAPPSGVRRTIHSPSCVVVGWHIRQMKIDNQELTPSAYQSPLLHTGHHQENVRALKWSLTDTAEDIGAHTDMIFAIFAMHAALETIEMATTWRLALMLAAIRSFLFVLFLVITVVPWALAVVILSIFVGGAPIYWTCAGWSATAIWAPR